MKERLLNTIYPIYTRMNALNEFVKALPDPVLIYQMGKVGSSSVYNALKKADVDSLHVHFITPQGRRSAARWRRNENIPLPQHIHTGFLLHKWIKMNPRKIRIITLVRDPVAVHLSGSYMLKHLTGLSSKNLQKSIQSMHQSLSGRSGYIFHWFENEINALLGINILEEPFDRNEGYSLINRKNISILVLKLENLDDLFSNVLRTFVGKAVQPAQSRVEQDAKYEEIKSQIHFPETELDRIYGHPWMKHFYSENEIQRFKNKWT